MTRKKLLLGLLTLVTVASLVCGCGSTGGSYSEGIGVDSVNDAGSAVQPNSLTSGFGIGDFKYNNNKAEAEAEAVDDNWDNDEPEDIEVGDEGVIDELTLPDDKLIYFCDIDIETKDFEGSREKLNQLIKDYKMVVESENYYNDNYGWYMDDYDRYASQKVTIKLRIPSKYYSEFVNRATELGNIRNKESSVENMSTVYSDNETRLKTLTNKRDRFEELLTQANTIEEILSIENEIEKVTYEIDTLKSDNKTIDLGVMYSYITIELKEVGEYTEKEPVTVPFITELINAFKNSWKDLVSLIRGVIVGIARISLVFILPMGLIIWGIVVFLKKMVKKEEAKKRQVLQKSLDSLESFGSGINTMEFNPYEPQGFEAEQSDNEADYKDEQSE